MKQEVGTIVAVLSSATIIRADGKEFYGHFSSFVHCAENEIQKGLPVEFLTAETNYTGPQDKRPPARYIKLLTK